MCSTTVLRQSRDRQLVKKNGKVGIFAYKSFCAQFVTKRPVFSVHIKVVICQRMCVCPRLYAFLLYAKYFRFHKNETRILICIHFVCFIVTFIKMLWNFVKIYELLSNKMNKFRMHNLFLNFTHKFMAHFIHLFINRRTKIPGFLLLS